MIKKINRRDFLKETSLLSLVATSVSFSSAAKEIDSFVDNINIENLIRVYQTATDTISTFLVIVHVDSFDFKIRVEDQIGFSLTYEVTEVKLLDSRYVIKKVFITGLSCLEKYKVILLNSDYKQILQKSFSSLNLEKLNPKIAFLTCCNHRNADLQSYMFKKLVDSQPDMILILGDLVYANSPLDTFLNQAAKPAEALSSYLRSLFTFDLFNQDQLTPIFSVWDDHDMGFNNANTSHPYKELMLK
ncbi:MAG: hypothetical protein L6Q37_14830, partial [Bdellovibrionaceae bacterium]|nr:hypothetical protein [Pseudobdellovibrionaceae bacterium]